ncbi:MAG: ABC transporter permease [Candidatus Zhuqueibacterota bacterium]
MLKNYIKIAFRNVGRNKGFSAINILGLAVGLAVCMVMLTYVMYETSFENFHEKKSRIYRIMLEWGTPESKMIFAGSMPALAPALNTQSPEVERAIRIRRDYDAIFTRPNDESIREDYVFLAEPGIFDIFTFDLIQGDTANALSEPFSLVMTESQARKYFGAENPVGRTLVYQDSPLKITGVMRDFPRNTHLNCQFIISYATFAASGKVSAAPWDQWGDDFTYLLLKERATIGPVMSRLADMLKENTNDWFALRMKFIPLPLSEIHWDMRSNYDLGPKGNKMYVTIFLAAAFFVLIIACFNFINLSTSRYLNRAREIGIRKVVGASRPQLIHQLLIESFLITLFAIAVGFVIFELLRPLFYDFVGTDFYMGPTLKLQFSILIIGLIVTVSLIAGGYPALFLSRFRPVDILKKRRLGLTHKLNLRKFIVVLQFALTLTLILGTAIIYKQLNYMKNAGLGFDKNNVLLLNFPLNDDAAAGKYSVLRDELLKNPNVLGVSSAYTLPGINSRFNISVTKAGSPAENSVNLQALPADFGFAETMKLAFIEGRNFSREISTDAMGSVILNESAVRALGLAHPVGALLHIPGRSDAVSVIGIVRDFHIQSFHKKINPALILIDTRKTIVVAMRLNPDKIPETISHVREVWTSVLPGYALNHRFLEDVYSRLYRVEEKSGELLSIFTGLALFVSCLGLYGLSSFVTKNRTKEIGIRKVMGASAFGITFLISRQFIIWILGASALAIPFSFCLMHYWLNHFAYRTQVNWWLFMLAVAFELAFALATSGFQTIRAALANPVESLRCE